MPDGGGGRSAGRALAWLWRFAAATGAATAATAPLVAHHFGEVAPLAPLGNLALVPLVELGVVPAGLLGAASRRDLGAAGPAAAGGGRAGGAGRAGDCGGLPRPRAAVAVPHAERAGDGGAHGGRRASR